MRVIVGVRAGFSEEGNLRAREISEQRARIRTRVDDVLARVPAAAALARRFRTIPFFAAHVNAATLDDLARDPDVTSVEEDVADAPVLAESIPLIGAPAAWNEGYTGAGWTVAVLDTGVEKTHPFLSGRVVSEACYSNAGGTGGGISLCPGGASSSTADGSGLNCSSVFSGCYHGTHVAGIAAGRGATFSGVAPDASLISIQVFTAFAVGVPPCGVDSCVVSFTSDQILGLERVLALHGTLNIAAVNMSLGGSTKYTDQLTCDLANTARKAAIDNLRSVGIATVIAAGNSGYQDGLSAPACISSAVSVGSTSKSDLLSTFSNTASFLSLVAPGEQITSSVPGGGFQALSGTSMAAPHVAGAWAVMKSRRAGADVATVLTALRTTAVPIADATRTGSPFDRIRVDQAVAALPLPIMALDAPANGSAAMQPFTVWGWAADQAAASGTGIDAIHVWAVPVGAGDPIFLGAAAYGISRGDVGAIFGPRFTDSGFALVVRSLPAGLYQIVAYAHTVLSGSLEISRSAVVNVQAPLPQPVGAIDAPADRAVVTTSFAVSGWAVDLAAPTGSGIDAIHVYAFPTSGAPATFLGVATQGLARPDVGAAFGAQFGGSGYWLNATLTPGMYTLVVYARSSVTGVFSSYARALTVRTPGDPLLSIDSPVDGTTVSQPFLVAGWAVDRDATTGTGVDAIHVWAFPVDGSTPIWIGVPEYGYARPDVAAILGATFEPSGFNLSVGSLPSGTYHIAVYVHSSVTGTFSESRAVTVTIP